MANLTVHRDLMPTGLLVLGSHWIKSSVFPHSSILFILAGKPYCHDLRKVANCVSLGYVWWWTMENSR